MLRILIVDDSEADRLEYRRLLQKHVPHWTVVEAETGEDALRTLGRETVDCVLLDYSLPDMDGSGFLHRLNGRPDADLTPVPVAVLTGHDDHRIAQSMLHEGAQDYLIKGTLTPLGLVRVVENAVEKHAIRWELERSRAAAEMRTWQLERTQEQLREKVSELDTATRAKDQFVAVMSHEMRTPLNAILGYAELLEVGVHGDLPPAARSYIERIRLGGRHLLDLINDVLDLSRVDAEEVDLAIRPVDPVAVIEEVTHLLEREAAQKDVSLVLQPFGAPVPAVAADLPRLRQIVTNLVANAIKFTDAGRITLALEERDGHIALLVRDTGVGIPAAMLPMIFDRFFQVDGSFTRQRGGIGLGLAISQRLARQMGGSLDATSEEGKGSTFTLVLPIAHQPNGVEPPSSAGAELPDARPAAPAVRVLAYSENESALAALRTHVEPSVDLRWTTSPDAVRELAIEQHVELIVLDISSAGGGAWTAAGSLQDVPELSSTAVLLLPTIPESASAEPTAAIDLGWVSLVPKPFTEQQLTSAVARAADSRDDADGEQEEPKARPCEVLVVDDDPESRHVARTFLVRAGLHVREATDGESALVAMRFRRPGVVVLDLMMPVIDGFGVLAAMRADTHLSGVPVVVLSAKTLTAAERAFLGRSAVRVLQKGEHRLSDVAALVLRAAGGRRT